MKTMTIGKKISLACVALVVLTIILGTVSIWNISRINTQVNLIASDALPGTISAGRLESLMMEQRLAVLRHMLMQTTESKTQAESVLADGMARFQAEMKAYDKTITNPRDRELFGKIALPYEQFGRAWARVLPVSRGLKNKEAFELWNMDGAPAAAAAGKEIKELVELNRTQGDSYVAATLDVGASARLWTLVLLGFSIVSGGLLAFVIVRGVSKALKQAVSALTEGAEQVASAASQVSSSSQSLAQGASEQAASLEETSASSEEINAMSRKNSENSRVAADLMTQSQQKFIEANQALEQTVAAMGEINTQSGKISKIIKVIDEIAFQTNILALNAAVEAARAGEAGMGFAVVADEVRNLAQRCAQAAKDTAELIEESIAKSNDGKSKVDQVALAIRTITEDSSKVRTLVDEVNLGSGEQARGTEQISKAITHMEQVTQQNAASAEESAAAAEELTAQSETLKDVVATLAAMVGGGREERLAASGRNRAAETRRPGGTAARHAESTSGLPALRGAVSRKARNGHAAKPLVATAGADQNAFPMEEEFQEF